MEATEGQAREPGRARDKDEQPSSGSVQEKRGGEQHRQSHGAGEREHVSKEKQMQLKRQKRGDLSTQGRRIHGDATTGGDDQGDGKTVFAQLKTYLANEAPPQYVCHMVLRLMELATERRFKAHQTTMLKQGCRENEQTMRGRWKDAVPPALEKKYNGLRSYWDKQNKQHEARLYSLMKEWVMDKSLPQGEIEARLRFFHFVDLTKESQEATDNDSNRGSYLGAVTTGLQQSQQQEPLTAEQTRLREMCVAPAQALTKLRKRTEDEDKALIMILNHEIEVPAPPNFLVQSMTARELACFTDIFLAIEYPLYAHLAPGQRFGENLSKQAILAHIYAGAEATAAQKQEIAEFKQSISRISLDMKTRVITVTFKGKQSASRWIDWKLPLAAKWLPLIDYERQRETAKDTNEIIRLDYYTFTVAIRRGTLSSQDMYAVLATEMNLGVHSMMHPVSESTGLNDKEWTVWIRGQCPAWLRSISVIVCADAEIVVHHHEINVNWPCRTCLAPEHPTKYCKVLQEAVDRCKHQHTHKIEAILPSKLRSPRDGYRSHGLPKTLEQLKQLLSQEGAEEEKKEAGPQEERKSPRKRRNSPAKMVMQRVESQPTLPKEWGQHKYPATQKPIVPDDTIAQRESKDIEATPRNGVTAGDQRQAETISDPANEEKRKVTSKPSLSSVEHDEAVPMDTEEESNPRAYEHGRDTAMDPSKDDKANAWTRGRSPTKKPIGKAGPRGKIGRIDKKMRGRHEAMAKRGSFHRGRGSVSPKRASDGAGENQRRVVSHSPKRRVPAEWEAGRSTENEIALSSKSQKREGEARSLSPAKSTAKTQKHGDKEVMQSFIHQYMQSAERNGIDGTKAERKTEAGSEVPQPHPTNDEENKIATAELQYQSDAELTEEEDCKITKVNPGSDEGAPLKTWLAVLGGQVADVAASGQCGWLAFYAALHNVKDGLEAPSADVAEGANELKKQVLNGMIANLVDEAQLHPVEIKAEVSACCREHESAPVQEQICALANHYVAQRQKSAKLQVPIHFWVRPTHIKAMAMHARETIYVLDVQSNGKARMQAYAYHDERLEDDDNVETGSVQPIATQKGMELLQDLVAAGILPPVLLLKWNGAVNHFQAVVYDEERFACYTSNIAELAKERNNILHRHGFRQLDSEPYDRLKTARAATKELKTMRRSAKLSRKERGVYEEQLTTVVDLEEDPQSQTQGISARGGQDWHGVGSEEELNRQAGEEKSAERQRESRLSAVQDANAVGHALREVSGTAERE